MFTFLLLYLTSTLIDMHFLLFDELAYKKEIFVNLSLASEKIFSVHFTENVTALVPFPLFPFSPFAFSLYPQHARVVTTHTKCNCSRKCFSTFKSLMGLTYASFKKSRNRIFYNFYGCSMGFRNKTKF